MLSDEDILKKDEYFQRLKRLCIQHGFIRELEFVWPGFSNKPLGISSADRKVCSSRPAMPYVETVVRLRELLEYIAALGSWGLEGVEDGLRSSFHAFEQEIHKWEAEKASALNGIRVINPFLAGNLPDFVLGLFDSGLVHCYGNTVDDVIDTVMLFAERREGNPWLFKNSDGKTRFGDIDEWPRRIKEKVRTDKDYREKFYSYAGINGDDEVQE